MKILIQIIALLAITFSAQIAAAQNGEELFKIKCSACHTLGANSVGPDLKGAKQKWEAAGEGTLFYEWIVNSKALIEKGTSKVAEEVKEFSPTDIPVQEVTNEEIDAMFAFVESYEPPVKVEESVETANAGPEVVVVPNYKKNLTLFYFLLVAILIQLVAIFAISGSVRSFVKMENYKATHKKDHVVKSILVLAGMFGLMTATNSAMAFNFVAPGGTEQDLPWLLVEDIDLMVLVIINLAMLFIVFYIRGLFMDIAKMIRPPVAKKVSARKQRRMNKFLTDAVPIEEEHTILMHHEYDGIKELDNNLPPWWVWGFVATIIFSIIYIFNYHIFKTGDLQLAEYNKSMVQGEKDVKAYLDKMAMNVDETNVTLLTGKSDLSTGATLFETNCISCHNSNGAGNEIGPNLTDNAWIYGFDIKDVFTSVKLGRPNGMPDHSAKLNPIQLQQVASFVLSLPVAEGKDPQGEIIEK